jgi:bifunctional chitinase/lysozyme
MILGKIVAFNLLAASAFSAHALEGWHGQRGEGPFEVVFNSQVWKNTWWVEAEQCPAKALSDPTNPWAVVRSATAEEVANYGNPLSCDRQDAGQTNPDFDPDKNYPVGAKVLFDGANYIAKRMVAESSFQPNITPWAAYRPMPQWDNGTAYAKGQRVLVAGTGYEALFWTQGDDPSQEANQSPDGHNGKPWKPLGAMRNYTSEELASAPAITADTLYPVASLVRFQEKNYLAAYAVKDVYPEMANPWQIYTEWGKTKDAVGKAKQPWPKHVYAPYVDATLNDVPDLATLAKQQGVNHFTLAFVVAKSAQTCVPTWGTYYNMNNFTAMYNNIRNLREAGGDVMVSIGGAANAPLSAACSDIDELAQNYLDIVDNLNLHALDFDIEGNWVADPVSIERRSKALAIAQAKWAAAGQLVAIWYTLPTLPAGLTADGMAALRSAKANGVDLAGINVMTMDYGDTACPPSQGEGANVQGRCNTDAIDNLFKNVKSIFTEKSDQAVWAMLGTTPMIGVNDVESEQLYIPDAQMMMEHARAKQLGMIGIWSVGRDQPGPAGQVSAEHSGLTAEQAPKYAFSRVFAPFTNDGDQTQGPIADAGRDQKIRGPAEVTLDGRNSHDETGIVSYRWSQPEGQNVVLRGADTSVANFSVGDINASYRFTLTVDNGTQQTSDEVKVIVSNEVSPPIILLSPEVTVKSGERTQVTATVNDPEQGELHFAWQVPAEVSAKGQDSHTLEVTAPTVTEDTVYPLMLTVDSSSGESASTSTNLIVKAKTECSANPTDPLAAQYPLWSENQTYATAGTIVNHDNLRWSNGYWTKGERPGQAVVWTLLSKVTLPWLKTSYAAESEVSYDGHLWRAVWWANAEDEPGKATQWTDLGEFSCQ